MKSLRLGFGNTLRLLKARGARGDYKPVAAAQTFLFDRNLYRSLCNTFPRVHSVKSLCQPCQLDLSCFRYCVSEPVRSQTVPNHSSEMPEKQPFERLPKTVIPKNYELKIEPNLADFTFTGSQNISVEVTSSTSEVKLNSAEIKITSAKFGDQTAAEIKYEEKDELAVLVFKDPLSTGAGNLHMEFTGVLNDKMKGFYRSKYTDTAGKDQYMAVTQFESTDARRAFPCWDEPAFKATFDITLVVPKNRVALSNMPVKQESVAASDANKKVLCYERSPVMSTYLLAFVVGEFDYVEAKDKDGVLIRVYTPVGKQVQGEFALKVAVETLPFYKNYFKIAYPLPKMDLIAIPDFAAGAMENWGLVTYRETALLVDPKQSSQKTKQWVALVVGHELAHQWFGNLVTMEWWTHLWLNEGFASWIEYLCVDHVFPEYDIWTQFASSDFVQALSLDSLNNSHAIEVPVGHPDEVDEIFDAISYSKGASVIRMLHHYIKDEDFRKGMNSYLKTFQYTNAFTEDLWKHLGDASGKPVHDVMTTWTKQMGYPVLTVKEEKKGTTRVLSISQKKFCADGQPDKLDSKWMVPVSVCSQSKPESSIHDFVLEKMEETVEVTNVPEGDWLKLNVGGVGFYRTNYSSDMLLALKEGLKAKQLPPRDRLALQNDLFALARAGEANLVDVLKVAEGFTSEQDYTVWCDLDSNFAQVSAWLQYTDHMEAYRKFLRHVYKDIVGSLGFDPREGEGHLVPLLRALVIRRQGMNGDESIVAEAKKRFELHCSGKSAIPADMRAPIYAIVMKHGDGNTLEQMVKLLDAADMHEEKERVIRNMGCTKDPELLKKVLEIVMSDKVRTNDTVFGIASTCGSKEGQQIAWNFVKENWTKLYDQFKGFLLARLIKSTTDNFASEEKAKEIEEFFQSHEAPAADRTIQQSLETIRLNAKQIATHSKAMGDFLTQWK